MTTAWGSTNDPAIRNAVWAMTDGHCAKCSVRLYPAGSSARSFEVDHVQAASRGGLDHLSNYQPLCRACNRAKSDSMTVDYRARWGCTIPADPRIAQRANDAKRKAAWERFSAGRTVGQRERAAWAERWEANATRTGLDAVAGRVSALTADALAKKLNPSVAVRQARADAKVAKAQRKADRKADALAKKLNPSTVAMSQAAETQAVKTGQAAEGRAWAAKQAGRADLAAQPKPKLTEADRAFLASLGTPTDARRVEDEVASHARVAEGVAPAERDQEFRRIVREVTAPRRRAKRRRVLLACVAVPFVVLHGIVQWSLWLRIVLVVVG